LSSTCQPPSGPARTSTSGATASAAPPGQAPARPRIEPAEFAQHVQEIVLADAAHPGQGGEIPLGEQVEPAEQRRHGGIEPVARPELDAKALRQVAGEKSGGLELLANEKHRLHRLERKPEAAGDLREGDAAIAGLVQFAGQQPGAEPLGGIGKAQRDLAVEKRDQARPARRQVVHVPVARSAPPPAPLPAAPVEGQSRARSGPRRSWRPGSSGKMFSSDVSSRPAMRSAEKSSPRSNQSAAASSRLPLGRGRRRVGGGFGAGEKRIFLDLFVDEAVELLMGELEQPDRLHELRRHHQRLRRAQLQFGRQRHGVRNTFRSTARRFPGPIRGRGPARADRASGELVGEEPRVRPLGQRRQPGSNWPGSCLSRPGARWA
jgi:hypothetical protein